MEIDLLNLGASGLGLVSRILMAGRFEWRHSKELLGKFVLLSREIHCILVSGIAIVFGTLDFVSSWLAWEVGMERQ